MWINPIEKYMAIPYKLGFEGWDGADCWGLVRLVYATELGISLPSYNKVLTPSDRVPPGLVEEKHDAEIERRVWQEVHDDAQWQLLDVAAFTYRVGGFIDHIGVVVECSSQTVMMATRQGVLNVSMKSDSFWARRLQNVYRYAGPRAA